MKLKLFVFASAAMLLAAPAMAANKTGVASTPPIPPVPASSLQVPPEPTTPAAKPAAAPAAAGDKKIYTVAESRPYQSKGNNIQHFVDYINLKAGQDRLPLKLTFTNTGFNSLSSSIAGYPVLDRKKVSGLATFDVDMTGNLGAGSSQVLIDAIGPAGCTLTWKLTAPKPTLKAAKPAEVGPGDTVTLDGSNFCPEARFNQVTVGGKSAPVQTASDKSLTIKIPEGLETGKQKVQVTVIGQKTIAIEISVSAPPELSGVSLNSAPPGQEIVITGKNFAKDMSKNKVTIGGAQAQIVSGDTNSLTIVIPDSLDANMNPAYSVPIEVEVGKMKSKENVTIDIQSRVF